MNCNGRDCLSNLPCVEIRLPHPATSLEERNINQTIDEMKEKSKEIDNQIKALKETKANQKQVKSKK